MSVLSGQLPVSGHGTRVPVRVEAADGRLAAAVNAQQDGSWTVNVPPGTYTVRPKWLDAYEDTAWEQPATALTTEPAATDETDEAASVSPGRAELATLLARRRTASPTATAATLEQGSRARRTPRDGGRR